MKRIRLIVGFLACSFVLLFGIGTASWAEDDEMAKPMKLTLDVAKAVVEGKDVGEGLKAVAKDELSNWMWNSIGGYEKIVFQNSEAEIPGVKEKAKKIWEAIQSIDKAATAIAEGKYDDALISSVDVVVGAVDHPAASALWAAVKMTYESHKLVQDTQAELEIEALYGIMSNDRRMMGVVDPKSDQPPMIPETAAMSDHFYEKYVMTNDGTRQMLKAYVTKVIGDEWPEESWGDYLKGWMAIGSGVDTARSAEIEAMGTEWKQKARTWISRLIKDVNKQAKVAWGEVRVRQQLAEFKRFSDRAAMFYNGDFEQMLKEFNAIKQYQKEEASCAKILGESPKAYAAVEKAVNEMKDSDIKKLGGWRAQVEEWQLKLLSASSKMQIIRKNELAASLSSERNRWMKLDDRIGQIIAEKNDNPQQVVDKVSDEGFSYAGMGCNPYQQAFFSQVKPIRDGYYDSLFVPKLKPFKFEIVSGTVEGKSLDGKPRSISLTGNSEAVMKALMESLNIGDFNGASAIIGFWNTNVAQAMGEHFTAVKAELRKVSGEPAELITARAALEAAIKQYWEAIKPLQAQLNQLGAAASNLNWNDPQRRGIEAQMGAIYNQMNALGAAVSPYYRAVDLQSVSWHGYSGDSVSAMGGEAAARLEALVGAEWTDRSAEFQAAYSAYKDLADVLVKQMEAYTTKFDAIEKQLPDEYMFEHYNKWADEMAAQVSGNAYTFFVAAKERGDQVWVHSMPSVFLGMAQQIRDGVIDESRPLDMITGFESRASVWKALIKEWTDLPKMSAEDANEIRVLVNPKFDPESYQKRIAKAVLNAQALMSSFPSKLKTVAQHTQTDRENREKDADKLEAVGKRLQKFFNGLKQKNLIQIKYDVEVVLPPAGESGMIIGEKPFRHYLIAQELKAITDPIRAEWSSQPDAGFAATYAPGYVEKFLKILTLSNIPPAREENFINPLANQVLYKSDLDKASKVLLSIKIPDTDYEKKLAQVAQLVPGMMRVVSSSQMKRYEEQAKLFGMSSAEEYLIKTTGKGLSAPDYRLREGLIDELKDPGLQHEMGAQFADIVRKIQALWEENWAYNLKKQQEIAAAENARVVEEYRKKEEAQNEKANAERLKETNPSLYYGFQLVDPRINSHAINTATGDVIVTRDKLVRGEVQLTARMNKMDHVRSLFVSEDGGRSWKALPFSQNVSYSFTPIQGVRYRPIFKVKTDDAVDVSVNFLTGNGAVIYQDTNLEQDIVKAVQSLAGAYERADFPAFSALISRDFLGNKSVLEEGVRFDFDMFTGIALKIYINRISQVGNSYAVEIKWDKTQTPRKTGQEQRTSGNTTMTFVMEEAGPKIRNLRGSLIYATLSPEIAQASGLNSPAIDAIRTARDNRNPTQPGASVTEDTGGVTSDSSSQTLTVKSNRLVHAADNPSAFAKSYDFRNDAEEAENSGDFNFTWFDINGISGASLQKMATSFTATTSCPLAGYGSSYNSGTGVENGDVFCFVTADNYYGKFQVTNSQIQGAWPNEHKQFTFDYAIQTGSGSRNVTTP